MAVRRRASRKDAISGRVEHWGVPRLGRGAPHRDPALHATLERKVEALIKTLLRGMGAGAHLAELEQAGTGTASLAYLLVDY
jgi:hypothetical protein